VTVLPADLHVEALLDGCEGDAVGLRAALGERYVVLMSWARNDGISEHDYNTIYRASDGRLIHAECGGCSCGGSGSWSYVDSIEDGIALVPECRREA
jgi:hypothetical protein